VPQCDRRQTLQICNLGTAPLTWSLAEDVPAAWLGETPAGGTLQPADCVLVDVTFDSTGLVPGAYSVNVVITSDDLDERLSPCRSL